MGEMNISSTQNSLNIQHPNAIYTSRSLSELILNVKNNGKDYTV
jgi:hypothetical protein